MVDPIPNSPHTPGPGRLDTQIKVGNMVPLTPQGPFEARSLKIFLHRNHQQEWDPGWGGGVSPDVLLTHTLPLVLLLSWPAGRTRLSSA